MIELEKAGLDRFQKIMKIATPNPVYCEDSEKIVDAASKIAKFGYRRLPILSRKKLVGVITISDILGAFLRKENFDDSISNIMTRDVIFCDANETINYVLQKFKISRRGGFPVLDRGELVGMVSERDFVKHFSDVQFGTRVEDVMTKKPFFIASNLSILDAFKSIVNTHYRRLPVVDNNILAGIVTTIDFLRYIVKNNFNFSTLDQGVEYIIIKDVFTITKEKDVSEAVKIMKSNNIGGLPVTDKNLKLEGIIAERDILEEIV